MSRFKQRTALLMAATLSCGVLAAVLPASPANAILDRIQSVSPVGATNDQPNLTRIRFEINSPLAPNPPYTQDRSTRAELVRTDINQRTEVIAGVVYTCAEDPDLPCGTDIDPDSLNWVLYADFPLGSMSVNTTTGLTTANGNAPANAGVYDIYIYPNTSAGTTSPRDSGDVCFQCFSVVQGGPVAVTSVRPNVLNAGTTGDVGGANTREFVVTGDNFARGSEIHALFPGTNTVDPHIQFPVLINRDPGVTPQPRPATETVRKTTIRRTFAIDPAAAPGPRDIRVTNIGGSSDTLENGLTISPIFVSSVSPTAGSNSNPDVRVNVRGQFPLGSRAQLAGNNNLVIEAATLVASETDMLVSWNLQGVPAGRYRVRVVSPDNVYSSADACSPTFDVIDANGQTGTVQETERGTPCAIYGRQATPSPSASASTSTTPSPDPTGCGPGTGISCPPSPSPSATTGSPTPTGTRSPSPSVTTTSTTRPPSPTATQSGSPTPTDTRQPTRLTLSGSRPTIYSGEAISLTGQLFKADGTPVAGESVQILGKVYPAASATPVTNATTDSNGVFFVNNLRPPRGADYIATYGGSNSRDLARSTSNTVHVNVKTRIIVTSPRSGTVLTGSRRLVVFGTTTPNKSGSVIALQMRTGTSTRKIIAVGRVASNGGFEIHRYRDAPMPPGRYTLQVTIGPATGNSAAASKEFLLYVR